MVVVVNHRKEIAAVSGNDCCFIYFRDINNAKFLEKFQFSEHVERVYPFTRFIGIKYDTLPCIIFFEDIDSGEYICVSLAGLSQEQIISRMRDIFSHVYADKRPQFLRKLRSFQHSQVIRESKEKLLRNISEIGKETVIELIKSLLPLLR